MSGALKDIVKARRDVLGLSQRALPGIDQGQLSKIESGRTADPNFSVAQKLAAGLGITLDELAGAPASGVRMIALKEIEADPLNPRTVDVATEVDAEFVESIRVHGLLQAITVRAIDTGVELSHRPWRVAFGGRRHAALVAIHGPESGQLIPCKLTEATGEELLLQQLVENVERADMNPMDLAEAVTRLVAAGKPTDQLAASLRKGRRWVQEQASVGKWLTPYAKEKLRKGTLSISQAVALASERDPKKQEKLAARAELEALNEDDIRAIVAADREAVATEAAAEQEAAQPRLIEEPPPATAVPKYPAANEFGNFDDAKPVHRLRWKGRRGFFEISLVQFGDEKWTAGYKNEWRVTTTRVDGGGSMGPPSRKHFVGSAPVVSFLQCAEDQYKRMLDRSMRFPEDRPAMCELHDWIGVQIAGVGGSYGAVKDWSSNGLRPASTKAKAEPAPKPAPKDPPLTRAQVVKVPAWARPMDRATFVILEGQAAHLVKGWADMAATMFKLYEKQEPVTLRQLLERASWQDDTQGKPFDFGSIVYRITDKKAR